MPVREPVCGVILFNDRGALSRTQLMPAKASISSRGPHHDAAASRIHQSRYSPVAIRTSALFYALEQYPSAAPGALNRGWWCRGQIVRANSIPQFIRCSTPAAPPSAVSPAAPPSAVSPAAPPSAVSPAPPSAVSQQHLRQFRQQRHLVRRWLAPVQIAFVPQAV